MQQCAYKVSEWCFAVFENLASTNITTLLELNNPRVS